MDVEFSSGSPLLSLVIALIVWAYYGYTFMVIANKTNTDGAWMAWIPILNAILYLKIAEKPIWWIILFLIPLVNIIIIVIVMMGIAKARNKSPIWGVLTIIPFVNFIVPAYLAFSE